MIDLLLTEAIQDESIEGLAARYRVVHAPNLWKDPGELRRQVADTRALLVRNMTRVDADLIAAAPRLEVVGRIGVGLDNLDLAKLKARGIPVCYPPEENAVSVAEHVFALLFGVIRKLPEADRCVREGRWDRPAFISVELAGRTMGILGLGRVGFRVATRARAFGMEVLAYDPYLGEQHPYVTESGARLVSLEEVLRHAHVVSCHLPLTPETHHLLNAERLASLRTDAVVLNTSRGSVIDETALYEVMSGGHLLGAGLDVRESEPPGESPLHELPNVLFTPHVASWTAESLHRVISTVAADVDRVLSGQPPRSVVR